MIAPHKLCAIAMTFNWKIRSNFLSYWIFELCGSLMPVTSVNCYQIHHVRKGEAFFSPRNEVKPAFHSCNHRCQPSTQCMKQRWNKATQKHALAFSSTHGPLMATTTPSSCSHVTERTGQSYDWSLQFRTFLLRTACTWSNSIKCFPAQRYILFLSALPGPPFTMGPTKTRLSSF